MLLLPVAEWRGCPRATDTGRNQVLVLLWRADAENERGRPVQRDHSGPGKVLRGEPERVFRSARPCAAFPWPRSSEGICGTRPAVPG